MTTNHYDIGDRIEISTPTPFQDSDGVVFDPEKTIFYVKDPSGATTTYTYDFDGSKDSAITRNGVGDYTLAIDLDTSGKWFYRIFGEQDSGDNRGADEGQFFVRESKI